MSVTHRPARPVCALLVLLSVVLAGCSSDMAGPASAEEVLEAPDEVEQWTAQERLPHVMQRVSEVHGQTRLVGLLTYESRENFSAPLPGIRNLFPSSLADPTFGDGRATHWMFIFSPVDDPLGLVLAIAEDDRPVRLVRDSRENLTRSAAMTEAVLQVDVSFLDSDKVMAVAADHWGPAGLEEAHTTGMLLRHAPPSEAAMWVVYRLSEGGRHIDSLAIDAVTGQVLPEGSESSMGAEFFEFEAILTRDSSEFAATVEVDRLGVTNLGFAVTVCEYVPGAVPVSICDDARGQLEFQWTDPWNRTSTIVFDEPPDLWTWDLRQPPPGAYAFRARFDFDAEAEDPFQKKLYVYGKIE